MDLTRKTMVIRLAAAAAGVTAAVFVGMMYPTETNTVSVDLGSVNSVKTAVSASAQTDTALSEKTAESEKLPAFIEYRKADIHEYQMASVSSTPLVPLASKDFRSKAEEKQEEAEEEAVQEDFTVVIPGDGTTVYDNKPAPQGLTSTRSVANEYYTVKDLVSGSIVTKNAHEMLCMMVYNEIGAQWDEDAIKAQAVAAYSHLRYSDSINFVPTVGLKPGYPDKIEKCVSAVEGQAVCYKGSVINASYAASTAGYTADSYEIFGISYPYLKPVVSQYDDQDPNWGAVTKISPETIRKAFKDKYGLDLSDDYKNWFTVEYMHSGRYVGSINIDGRGSISGAEMRTLLKLRSSAFEISYSGGTFTFTTYGYGHGVGMSQWGAKLYADHGWTYDQILRHYYVNTVVSLTDVNKNAVDRGYKPPEKIVIPEDNDSQSGEEIAPANDRDSSSVPDQKPKDTTSEPEKQEPEATEDGQSASEDDTEQQTDQQPEAESTDE